MVKPTKDSKGLQTCLGEQMNVMHAKNKFQVAKKPSFPLNLHPTY